MGAPPERIFLYLLWGMLPKDRGRGDRRSEVTIDLRVVEAVPVTGRAWVLAAGAVVAIAAGPAGVVEAGQKPVQQGDNIVVEEE